MATGTQVAVVIPAGDLRIEAHFPAATAAGRLKPGQPARLRLDGFAWTAFGTAQAEVTRVGTEPREGRLPVELALSWLPPGVPAEHGLTGLVEVEIERVRPVVLLLRAAGARLPAPLPC